MRSLTPLALLSLCLVACELEVGDGDVGTFFPDTGTTADTGTGTDTGTTTDTGNDTPTGPISCTMWAGTGTCVTTATCSGITGPSPQCTGGASCCYSGALPTCAVNGNVGECTYTSACGSGFDSSRSTCTGPDNVECCYRRPSVETCEANGVDGVCVAPEECEFVSTPGICTRGGECCAEVETCSVDGVAGVCIDIANCDDGRETTSGLCPGGNEIRCCHDPVTSTGCESTQFTCDNGDCISKSDACDHKNDCGDYSDEFGCMTRDGEDCSDSQLACLEMCINASKACNGTQECEGGFDEADCD